jgi:transcriptional regulator with XRE-family HTH domain
MEPDPIGGSAQMFGLVLRQLRGHAGLSLRELGKRALYDYTRLSRAENGEALIPAEKVRLLDEVLQAGGLLIALRAAAGAATPRPASRSTTLRCSGCPPAHRRSRRRSSGLHSSPLRPGSDTGSRSRRGPRRHLLPPLWWPVVLDARTVKTQCADVSCWPALW